MIENSPIYKIKLFINDNFYILFVLLSFLSFRFSFPAFIRTAMWGLLILVNFSSLLKRKGQIDPLVFLYIFLGLFSILGWLQRDYPLKFFFTIFFESYIPIMFYFIGRESSENLSKFYIRSLYAFLFVNISGMILLYTLPSWYVEKSLEVLNQLGYYTEDTLKYSRFASFLDSYHTSNFSVYLLCISIGGFYLKHDHFWARFFYMFSIIIAIIGILLAQQRVAMFVGLSLLPVGIYLMTKYGHGNKMASFQLSLLTSIGLLLIIVLAIIFEDYFSVEGVLGRFSDDSRDSMVSGRSGTWLNAIMEQENFIWGHGLGGGGHLAQSIGIEPTVRDGSYFVILLETGGLSITVFRLILLSSLIRGFKRVNTNCIDFVILFFCCFSLIGANIIYYPYIIGIMWYAIGRINRIESDNFEYEKFG